MKYRITRNILLSLLLSVFAGCAHDQYVDAKPEHKQAQREAFSKLKIGDSRESVLKSLSYEFSDRSSVWVDEKLMQLDEVYNVETRRKFGLLFLENKLAAILDEHLLRQFSDCRWTTAAQRGEPWVQHADLYKDWLLRKDLLKSDFDFGASNTLRQSTPGGEAYDTVAYTIVYSPFILMALPFMGIEKLTGKMDRDDAARAQSLQNQKETRERVKAEMERAVSLIEIGDSPERVASKVGEIQKVIQRGGIDFYGFMPFSDWDYYKIGLGFREGKLVLLEYPEHTGRALLYWSQHDVAKDKDFSKKSDLASCPDRN